MLCKTSDNFDLYYEIQGNIHSNETIIFLNGLTQSTAAWFFMVPSFKDKYKIVLMDFIFQGQSETKAEWRTFDQHANDVKSLLDFEKIESTIVVGLSYGSLVAQHLTVLHPKMVSKLVLISTFAHKTPFYNAIELSWWRALEMGGYSLMLDVMLPNVLSENYFANPLVPIDMMKEAKKEVQQSKESIFKLMKATKERKDFRQDLEKITAPTLIIQGEKDLLLPVHLAEEMHKRIKNSKLIVIENAGHTLNLEHVSEVCGHVNNFLSGN